MWTFAHSIDLPKRALMAAVRGYQYAISPWLGSSCRFEPSCSAYALEALGRHGALAGTALAAGRVFRCHPWCDGGRDDVPALLPTSALGRGLLTRLLPGYLRTSQPLSSAEKNLP